MEIRVDRNTLPRVTKTDEGFLRGTATVTRIGVFEYTNNDGEIRRELRHPDDVMEQASLESLKMIPITVDHPGHLVTSDNADGLSVGQTGENISIDGRFIKAPLTITGKRGIEAVNSGKRELSLGYRLDLVEEKGEYFGQPYTHRQTNIRYNHLAIVDVARAGRTARLNLDGASVQSVNPQDHKENPVIKINIDGIQYDAAPEVARALEKAQSELLAIKTRADKAEAARDDAISRADKAEAEKVTEDAVEKLVAERTAARLDVLTRAKKVLGEGFNADGKTNREVQEAAVKSYHKDVDFTGKSDDYVAARFDAVVDMVSGEKLRSIDPIRKDTKTSGVLNADAAEEQSYNQSITNLNKWREQA